MILFLEQEEEGEEDSNFSSEKSKNLSKKSLFSDFIRVDLYLAEKKENK